jgi:phage terminase large subunit
MNEIISPSAPAANAFPDKLAGLFKPSRYKVLYGGRGGAKSWGIARALLLLGAQKPLRILCARELQNSMADSVHKLLSDQIVAMGLESFYNVQQKYIHGQNGTQFSFEGLRHNVSRIKSYEGVDIAWVEEAESTSATSWNILIPTIRKEGSEIWVSFNPRLETDATYDLFIKNTPKDCQLIRMNWRDNPWFTDVLRAEMLALKAKNYDQWLNVWEGECVSNLNGAVYAAELRLAMEEKRICSVPYEPTVSVNVFWDLGHQDSTALWFMQRVGFEFHLIDYYENNLQALSHYLKFCQTKRYLYDTMYIPHDGRAKTLGTGMSIEELMRKAGFKVRVVPKLTVKDGINAARTIFEKCYFDKEKCAEGLNALRHYHYEVDTEGSQGKNNLSREPVHDWTSHCADAFRYMAVAAKPPKGQTGRDIENAEVGGLLGRIKRQAGVLARANNGWMR